MKTKSKKIVLKLFLSYQRELEYLEEMALLGWFFTNIYLGIFYVFQKDEPRRMQYDIDRFNLPMKPTLEEIQHKEVFLEMAREMGWKEVAHDEGLTYYFGKEYVEGEVNELHNDEESRKYRATKFSSVLKRKSTALLPIFALLELVDLCYICWGPSLHLWWFRIFTAVYIILVGSWSYFMAKYSNWIERELSMSREEWKRSVDPRNHKTVHKLIVTVRFLSRFLGREAAKGWVLKDVTALSYHFERGENGSQIYTMDTKRLVNKRLKKGGKNYLVDHKDWLGLNNDWQIQSVKDAEKYGWSFVCALENRSIIYRGDPDQIQPLNDPKYDNSLRFASIIGGLGMAMVIGGFIGGVIGGLYSLFE